jgi:membrane-bound inhibitor of C-type lysozyme
MTVREIRVDGQSWLSQMSESTICVLTLAYDCQKRPFKIEVCSNLKRRNVQVPIFTKKTLQQDDTQSSSEARFKEML